MTKDVIEIWEEARLNTLEQLRTLFCAYAKKDKDYEKAVSKIEQLISTFK